MRKAYWRKNWVPEKCPECGQESITVKEVTSFDELLKASFMGWRSELGKYPGWGIDCWFGICGACAFEAALKQPSPFYDIVRRMRRE